MADPLSEIDQIRARHRQCTVHACSGDGPHCRCGKNPCDASLLLAALSEAEAASGELRTRFEAVKAHAAEASDYADQFKARLEVVEGALGDIAENAPSRITRSIATAALTGEYRETLPEFDLEVALQLLDRRRELGPRSYGKLEHDFAAMFRSACREIELFRAALAQERTEPQDAT